jgi:hypothetical protein
MRAQLHGMSARCPDTHAIVRETCALLPEMNARCREMRVRCRYARGKWREMDPKGRNREGAVIFPHCHLPDSQRCTDTGDVVVEEVIRRARLRIARRRDRVLKRFGLPREEAEQHRFRI